jgi:hypothetical protein
MDSLVMVGDRIESIYGFLTHHIEVTSLVLYSIYCYDKSFCGGLSTITVTSLVLYSIYCYPST